MVLTLEDDFSLSTNVGQRSRTAALAVLRAPKLLAMTVASEEAIALARSVAFSRSSLLMKCRFRVKREREHCPPDINLVDVASTTNITHHTALVALTDTGNPTEKVLKSKMTDNELDFIPMLRCIFRWYPLHYVTNIH